jgi:hypothetical protein
MASEPPRAAGVVEGTGLGGDLTAFFFVGGGLSMISSQLYPFIILVLIGAFMIFLIYFRVSVVVGLVFLFLTC